LPPAAVGFTPKPPPKPLLRIPGYATASCKIITPSRPGIYYAYEKHTGYDAGRASDRNYI